VASEFSAKVLARFAHVRVSGQQIEARGDGCYEGPSDIDVAVFLGHLLPNLVQIDLGVPRKAVRHSGTLSLFCCEARESSLMNLFSKLLRRSGWHFSVVSTSERGFGNIESRQQLFAPAFAFNP
jgi:hypothetical protein